MYRRRRTDQLADRIVELERRISQLSSTSDLSESFSAEEIRAIYELLPQYRTMLRQDASIDRGQTRRRAGNAERAQHARDSQDDSQIA